MTRVKVQVEMRSQLVKVKSKAHLVFGLYPKDYFSSSAG